MVPPVLVAPPVAVDPPMLMPPIDVAPPLLTGVLLPLVQPVPATASKPNNATPQITKFLIASPYSTIHGVSLLFTWTFCSQRGLQSPLP
jgi:hypothetical protein